MRKRREKKRKRERRNVEVRKVERKRGPLYIRDTCRRSADEKSTRQETSGRIMHSLYTRPSAKSLKRLPIWAESRNFNRQHQLSNSLFPSLLPTASEIWAALWESSRYNLVIATRRCLASFCSIVNTLLIYMYIFLALFQWPFSIDIK